MNSAEENFWTSDSEYQKQVADYERNIKVTHPPYAKCVCSDYCSFAASKVTYYEYRGPSIF